MIEVKHNGKEVQNYIVVLKEDNGTATNIKCDLFESMDLLVRMVQNVSVATRLPIDVLIELIKAAPVSSPDVTIDMNAVDEALGRK